MVSGIIVGTLAWGMLASRIVALGLFLLGGFSVVSGVFVALFVHEPVRGSAEPELEGKITEESAAGYRVTFSDTPRCWRSPPSGSPLRRDWRAACPGW